MKMNLKLTTDELMNVVDAAMDEAIDRGYDPDDEETADDMLHIVDAALSAMGIEIVEDEEEDFEEDDYDYDEEEDEDEDEEDYGKKYPNIESCLVVRDGQRYLTREDATDFLKIIKEMVEETMGDASDEEKYQMVCTAWIQFGKDFGIAGVLVGE